jgi:hypothetical protein
LGVTLLRAFDRVGDKAFLDEAIQCMRATVTETPSSGELLAGPLSDLAATLRTRFTAYGQVSDLHEAAAALSQAVATLPADHPTRAMVMSHLGNVLILRFEHVHDLNT